LTPPLHVSSNATNMQHLIDLLTPEVVNMCVAHSDITSNGCTVYLSRSEDVMDAGQRTLVRHAVQHPDNPAAQHAACCAADRLLCNPRLDVDLARQCLKVALTRRNKTAGVCSTWKCLADPDIMQAGIVATLTGDRIRRDAFCKTAFTYFKETFVQAWCSRIAKEPSESALKTMVLHTTLDPEMEEAAAQAVRARGIRVTFDMSDSSCSERHEERCADLTRAVDDAMRSVIALMQEYGNDNVRDALEGVRAAPLVTRYDVAVQAFRAGTETEAAPESSGGGAAAEK
jgi:hypothetical protein